MRACALTRGICFDAHFMFAMTTKNGFCGKFFRTPPLFFMICKCFVAFIASVVLVAALKLDGDDIKRAFVVSTSCLLIEIKAIDSHGLWASLLK